MKFLSKTILAIACLCMSFNLAGQNQIQSDPQPGTLSYYQQYSGNPTPQNGNGTFGVIFDSTACGLQYVAVSQKLGQRFTPAGILQPAPFVVSGIPANANIIKAFLCTNGSGNGAAQTATISGPIGTQSFPMAITGIHDDYCWTFAAAYTYRADVTPVIGGNGTYNVSGLLTCGPTAYTNDMSGAVLIVIYNDPSSTSQARLILADGAFSILGGSATCTMNYAPVCAASSNATVFCVVSDFQYANSSVTMNSSSTTLTGTRWDFIQLPTTVTAAQATTAFTATKAGDCFCLCLGGLYIPITGCTTCPSSSSVLQVSTASTADLCSLCNGTASVTSVSGGMGPYSYQWNTLPVQTTATATGLCAGTYSVIVTSSGGFYSDTETVVVPMQMSNLALSSSGQNAECHGDSTGTAAANASGGSPPYIFNWMPYGGTANTASGLIAQTYTCTVTDSTGCMDTVTISISEPPPLGVSYQEITDTVCQQNGVITLSGYSPAGGTFSGTGVSGNSFDPASASIGFNVITYTYSDTASTCSESVQDSIYVDLCMNITPYNTIPPNVFLSPGKIHVTCEPGAIVTLYDGLGRVICQVESQDTSVDLILSGASKGIYLIIVDQHQTLTQAKILVTGP